MAMPAHLTSPRSGHAHAPHAHEGGGSGFKEDGGTSSSGNLRSLHAQMAQLRSEVQESLRDMRGAMEATSARIDEVARQLREESQDREISFRKALSQRSKREDVLADITSLSQKLETSLLAVHNTTVEHLEAVTERTSLLEERCSRQEKALESHAAAQQAASGGKSDDVIVATTSPSSQGNVIRNNERIQQLTYRCDAVKAKCEQTENTLGRLVKRVNSLMGEGSSKDVVPLKAMADRVEFIQDALAQMNEHLMHERHEREQLSDLMSRVVQQVSRPTTPQASRRSPTVVRTISDEAAPRRIRIGPSSLSAAAAAAAAASVAAATVNPPALGGAAAACGATGLGSPMTPHAPLAFQARSATAHSTTALASGGSVGVLVQGSPIIKGRGSPAAPQPLSSAGSPRPSAALNISTTTLQTQGGQSPRLAARSSVPNFCGREVLGSSGGGGAILRTSSQPTMPGQASPVVSSRIPYVKTYTVQPPPPILPHRGP